MPGDVFDFPRMTGNSKQLRPWHKTQLHEDLVERCILLSTQPGDHVVDPFGGPCERLLEELPVVALVGAAQDFELGDEEEPPPAPDATAS